jgi:hypothetical protein
MRIQVTGVRLRSASRSEDYSALALLHEAQRSERGIRREDVALVPPGADPTRICSWRIGATTQRPADSARCDGRWVSVLSGLRTAQAA